MDVTDIRRRNAIYLGNKHTRAKLAKMLGYEDTNYLNGLCAERGHNMGGRTARRFEAKLALPNGWMDVPHPDLWAPGSDDRTDIINELIDGMTPDELIRTIELASKRLSGRND